MISLFISEKKNQIDFGQCWPCLCLNRVLKEQLLNVLPTFFFKTTAIEHKILTLIQFTDIFQWKSGKKMQSGWNLKVTIWKKT